jgi:hypothetical protein
MNLVFRLVTHKTRKHATNVNNIKHGVLRKSNRLLLFDTTLNAQKTKTGGEDMSLVTRMRGGLIQRGIDSKAVS